MSYERPETIISIHGAPRSGTTWLGMLMALPPQATLRYQPFFSYAFKGRLGRAKSSADIVRLLDDIFVTEDPFVLQRDTHKLGELMVGPPKTEPRVMVMKSVRFHSHIERILMSDGRLKAVGIVRHPCAVINSWLSVPREFDPTWDTATEWRHGNSKNANSADEYWGFERWLLLADLFLELEVKFPERFRLVNYELLVEMLVEELTTLLLWANCNPCEETLNAAVKSQQSDNQDHDYEVYKNPSVADRWRQQLSPFIREKINAAISNHELTRRFGWS